MKKKNENARWNNHDKNKNSVKNFGVVGHLNFGYPFNRKSFVKVLVPDCQGLSTRLCPGLSVKGLVPDWRTTRRHLIHYCFCEMDVFRQGGQWSFKYLKNWTCHQKVTSVLSEIVFWWWVIYVWSKECWFECLVSCQEAITN